MAKFDNILGTVGNTPVVKINKLAPKGINLYVKIEAFNPLGSVKDRLALGVIEAAEKSGELKPGQTVVEATSGNTGIGLAMVCAAKGYPLVVTMAETFSVERRKLMRFLGAKVVLTPAAERGMGMVNKAQELAKTHGWFLTRQFENEANPDMHSRTTAREIIDDFKGEKLDYWVTGFGTGGTLKGVARVLAKERPDTKIVVCEPADAPMLSSAHAAGAQPGRLAGQAQSGVQAASDAGLEPRLHSEDHRRSGRHERDRAASSPSPAPTRMKMQQGAGAAGRHLRRHHRRRDLRRRARSVQERGARLDHPRHAARHRRALSVDAAVRRRRRRHERGRIEDFQFDAEPPHAAEGGLTEQGQRHGLFAWIVIGLIAGWLANVILGGRGGLFHNLAVGLVGAIVGGFLFEKLNLARRCRISGAT